MFRANENIIIIKSISGKPIKICYEKEIVTEPLDITPHIEEIFNNLGIAIKDEKGEFRSKFNMVNDLNKVYGKILDSE